ncbi:MAG: M28 family metallopeptidase [Balneolaceae bacterium]
MNTRLTTFLLISVFMIASPAALTAQTNANSGVSSGPAYQPFLKDVADAVSAETIESYTRRLAGFENRHTLSDTTSDTRGIGVARRWIKEEFEKISEECGGCLEVFYVSDEIVGENRIPDPVNIVNVVAVQRGTSDPGRIVMMTGDIDSRVSDVMDYESVNPGANDNASGMAGTIEAARVLSQHEFPGTIVYAGLSGEEQGLFGGQILADYALENNWRIKAVLNNDMIGNIEGINGVINNTTARVFSEGTRAVETEREGQIRRFTGGEVDSPSRNLARYIHTMGEQYIDNLDVMMIYRLDRFGRGGHHRPFNDVGFPAVRIMETNEHYDRQHQDLRVENGREYGDVIEGVNFDYAAKLTALNAVSLAGMAKAPNPPVDVQISGAVQPSTTLEWEALDADENPHLEGYKIYWRLTTSPVWTHSRETGDVTEYTLENIVIDNYYFGVASVSEDGFESPVVFPGPNGSFGE